MFSVNVCRIKNFILKDLCVCVCYIYWILHSLTAAVTHARAKLLNPVALGEEICNVFGTRQHSFQVGMKHGVAEEQKSCVFRFWHSHVHTSLLHSGVTTNSRALGYLSQRQEEWAWNGFQDTYLSVVECQAWICDISQDYMYTQQIPPSSHISTCTGIFRAFPTNVKPGKVTHQLQKVISLKEQGICQWDVKISLKS